MEKDTKEKVTADEVMDDLIYLAELIDFMGITSCLAVRVTLSERMTDKLTDSIAGMADEVLEKWEDYHRGSHAPLAGSRHFHTAYEKPFRSRHPPSGGLSV